MTQAALQKHLAAARQWAREAAGAGWLAAEDAAALENFDATEPGALFEGDGRPLVAAFFGGTGVGKSSLLNRLAGEPVARVGVERPTSHEVSLYLHESVELARLPGEFPVERVRIARHRNAARRGVLWIDMPDMDSTDAANRAQALAWLPHIDVVIYVVSPERYRDDKGWRLLVQHGQRHAWLFVMNQSDHADPAQIEDFLRQLQRAGFRQPVVLGTDCQPETALRQSDDFTRLETLLGELV
ncbi:MAG TPA: GTPase domain-containing protein, partial [Methylococcaceae bacterium]|nr:GTPase domain-containing protein [Methylococcaceae bacterium]